MQGSEDLVHLLPDTDVRRVLASRPEMDRGATVELVQRVFAGWNSTAMDDDDHPLPFHPLELGEAALDQLFDS